MSEANFEQFKNDVVAAAGRGYAPPSPYAPASESAIESGHYAAVNWGGLIKVLDSADSVFQKLKPILDTLLPSQYDALVNIVAAIVHSKLHPTT